MTLDWDSFRVILAVAREGSLIGAARRLGVSHTTVGRQLKRAEDDFGARLFDRLSNGLFATNAGNSAIAVAKRMEREITAVNLKIRGTDRSESGVIRLSFPHMVLAFGLSDEIRAFSELYPNINFQLNATDTLADFKERELDVVIRAQNNPSSGLWGFKIATAHFAFYASRDFLTKWDDRIRTAPQTTPIPFIEVNTADPAADREQFIRHYPLAQTVTECNGLDSMIPLVRSGFGVGRLAKYMAKSFPELVHVCDCDDEWSRPLWILTHPDFRDTRRIRLFMDFIKERFRSRDEFL